MGLPISSNRYSFPSGYRGYVAFSGGAYNPWNGYNNGANSPNATIIGNTLQFVTSGAPTDTQVMTIFGPDGKTYKFQFLYAATAGNDPDAFEVRLPNSGASTAAQVMTALFAVASLAQATTEGGTLVKFPWNFQSINATTSLMNWLVNGNSAGYVAPANMAITGISAATPGQTGISASKSVCARAGFSGAFLPGP